MNLDPSIVNELFKVPSELGAKIKLAPSFVVLSGPSSRNVVHITHPYAKECVTVVSGGASAVLPLLDKSNLTPVLWFDNGDIGQGSSRTDDYANFLDGDLDRYIVINTRTIRENSHILIEAEDFFIDYIHRFILYDFYYYSGYSRNSYLRWQNRLLNILNFLVLSGSKLIFLFGSDGAVNRSNPQDNYIPDRSGYRGGSILTLEHNMHSIERSIPSLTDFWGNLGLMPEILNMSVDSTLRCFKKASIADLASLLDQASVSCHSRNLIETRNDRTPDNNKRHLDQLRTLILIQGPTLESLFYERDILLEQLALLYRLDSRITQT
jgi:hypothetical protein